MILELLNRRRLLGAFLLMLSLAVRGQQVTVYSYNFDTSAGTAYSTLNGSIGNNTSWNVLTSGTDMGARIDGGYLNLTNDATGANNSSGWALGYTLSPQSSPYSTTLNANPGLVTWTFNMRQSRTNPSGMSNNGYGNAFILAGTSNTSATTGSGYAIMLGNNGNTDPIRLVRYTAGLRSSTDLIASNTSGVSDFGHHYASIKVTYAPATNTWQLYVRKDTASSFNDPLTGYIELQGSVVNNGYTTIPLPLLGGFWNAGTKRNQTATFDNITITVATPVLASISPTSKVAGSPSFTLTVNGSNFTNASVIKWNGVNLATTFVSSAQLTATIPSSSITTEGSAQINVGTGSATSNSATFYIDPLNQPSISTSVNALNTFTTVTGTASASKTFTSTGTSLNTGSNIIVTAPTNFEISTASGGPYSATLSVPAATTTIYTRVKASTPAGIYNGYVITASSSGAATKEVSVSAIVLDTEPTTTTSTLTFTNVNSIQGTINWSGGNGGNHLVVVRPGSAVSGTPADGTSYYSSAQFGSGSSLGTDGSVVYAGSSNSITVTGLMPTTTYYVSVFEYNGSNGTENYRATPISGNFTTQNAPLGWQIKSVNAVYKIDFDNTVEGVNNSRYEGAGLSDIPDVGELNSNTFVLSSLATNGVTFGGDIADDDPSYGNGLSDGSVTDGGFYAFRVANGNYALGLQPDAGYPSSSITLRLQNQTGATVTSLNIGYKIYVRNDEAGAENYNFSYAATNANNVAYTAGSVLNQTTTAAADGIPGWKMYYKVITLTGLNITANSYYYLRWSENTASGSAFDEIALDDITVVANPTTVFGPLDGIAETAVFAGNSSLSGDTTISGATTFNGGKVLIGSNTLNLNGTVTNTTTGGIRGSAVSNLTVGGTVSPTLSFDQTTNGTTNLLNNLTIATSSANTTTFGNNAVVNGALTVNASQTLALGTNTLTGTLTSITNDGTITTTNTSTTPFAANKTWAGNGILIFNASGTAQYLPGGTYNKVTVNTSGGVTATGNVSLTGDLYLPNANPSTVKGSFDTTAAYALTMGPVASNTGVGDVSGTVTRNSGIITNTVYTFGHPNTTIYFPNSGTFPTSMSLKTILGSAPAAKSDAILRSYDFIQTGGSGTKAVISAHYLDSELNGNTENKLVDWVVQVSPSQLIEQGRTNYSITDNYVELANVNVAFFSSSFGNKYLTLANSQVATVTWNGSQSNSWTTAANWTPNATPSDATSVIIPDAATTPNDPILNSSVTVGKLTIETGGILNAPAGGQFNITQSNGAWINHGTFNPSTSTVTLNVDSSTLGDVTLGGSTTFYNLVIPAGTNVRPLTDNIIDIAGTFTNSGNFYASAVHNTVIYSGTNQTLITPNGNLAAYHNLTINGTGAVFPTSLKIAGDLLVNQSTDFTGKTITMLGVDSEGQLIGGSANPSFNNLIVNKPTGSGTLLMQNDISVTGTLTLTSGLLDIASHTLTLGANPVAGSFSATTMIDADGGGVVRRPYTGTGSYTFPIGETTSNTTYSPITVNINYASAFNNAYVSVNVTDATHPDNHGTESYLTRYWNVTQTGMPLALATITATYVTGDAVGGESALSAAQLNGTFDVVNNPWSKFSTLTSNTLTAANTILTENQTSYFTGITTSAVNVSITGEGTFCQGTYVELSSVVSGGVGSYIYEWSNSLGSADTAEPPTNTAGTTTYTLTVRDSNGTVGTDTATVTVTQEAVAGTLSGNQDICASTTPSPVSLSGYTGNVVRWELSEDTAFTNPAYINSTSATLSGEEIGPQTATAYLRAVVQNGACDVVYTDYVVLNIAATTWNGTSWDNGTPDGLSSVIFTGDYTATSDFSACTLTVDNGANVVIPSGYTATINSIVTVNPGATLTVENNAALVQVEDVENVGDIIVEKTANALFRLDYTFWSAPVTGQQLQAFSPLTLNTRFFVYGLNGGNEEAYIATSAEENFTPGTGYLIRMPNQLYETPPAIPITPEYTAYNNGTGQLAFEGVFTGVPNNGDITVSVSYGHVAGIGNPYPSPIGVKAFFEINQDVLSDGSVIDANLDAPALYFWRKKNDGNVSSYATLTLGGFVANAGIAEEGSGETTDPDYEYGGQDQAGYYTGDNSNWLIAPGQGFFVNISASPLNNYILFNNDIRRSVPATGQPFFRNGSFISHLWLNLKDTNSGFSQLAIGYKDGATLGLDYGYDGKKINGGGNVSFYSTALDTPLAIQVRPAFTPTDAVPVGYKANNAGSYTISLDHVDGLFEEGQDIYIKDNLTGITHDIKAGDYIFTTEAGSFDDRFEVIYIADGSLGNPLPVADANLVMVYKQSRDIHIDTGSYVMQNVNIYDIHGRLIYNADDINATETVLKGLRSQEELIIIEITTNKGKVTKKLIF